MVLLSVGIAVVSCLALTGPTSATDRPEDPSTLHATVRVKSYHNPVGQPVWAQFSIENQGNEPVSLTVPNTEPDLPNPEMGLPLTHVFGAESTGAVLIQTESGRQSDHPVGYRPPPRAPLVLIGAHGVVGTMIDLRDYFPVLRGAGQYRVTWKPYGGTLVSNTAVVHIAPLKQAEIVTDEGVMRLEFYYQDAPQTVTNFIDLASAGFYNGQQFHRLEPGYFLQTGCPRGNGTGIRLDGKRVPPEFNDHVHDKGTVSMALLDDDPESGSSQFFICNTRQKEWDGKYTVFAHLVDEESLATLDRLMSTAVDDHARPVRSLYLRAVRIIDAPTPLQTTIP